MLFLSLGFVVVVVMSKLHKRGALPEGFEVNRLRPHFKTKKNKKRVFSLS